jgi:hypothetical protein
MKKCDVCRLALSCAYIFSMISTLVSSVVVLLFVALLCDQIRVSKFLPTRVSLLVLTRAEWHACRYHFEITEMFLMLVGLARSSPFEFLHF